jgi:hypothetical protein
VRLKRFDVNGGGIEGDIRDSWDGKTGREFTWRIREYTRKLINLVNFV